MIVLDTDHLSILQQPQSPLAERLYQSMSASLDADFATTVISLEEQMRGWLAAINRQKDAHSQTPYYLQLAALNQFYCRWKILPFDKSSADQFSSLKKAGIRIGTMDLKIASIVLNQDALLLTANVRDFNQVPGLRTENWLQ
jgi:tRNA(fMet)-specific endonuclease VapC